MRTLPRSWIVAGAIALLQTGGAYAATAAPGRPVAGRPCPDFVLEDVSYFRSPRAALADFRGRWLILDFWTRRCPSCIAGFAKMNRLQQQFGEDIQFMLVGRREAEYATDISKVYERYRDKMQLQLASAYSTDLFVSWQVTAVPYLLIIDPQGVVRAVTDGRDMTEEKLQALLEGGNPAFFYNENIPFDPSRLLLEEGNGGTADDLLYRSILARWRGGRQYLPTAVRVDPEADDTRFQAAGLLLRWLYNYAYFGQPMWRFEDPLYGRVWQRPLLEIADPSAFDYDFVNLTGLYSYSVTVPPGKGDQQHLMNIMQRDLRDGFGYEVAVQSRQMPYWRLTATETARSGLKTRGPVGETVQDFVGFSFHDVPVGKVLAAIQGYHQDEPPFIDETGIVGNIDLTIEVVMTDFAAVRQALRVHGLQLEPAAQPMTVLVITDPQPASSRLPAGGRPDQSDRATAIDELSRRYPCQSWTRCSNSAPNCAVISPASSIE